MFHNRILLILLFIFISFSLFVNSFEIQFNFSFVDPIYRIGPLNITKFNNNGNLLVIQFISNTTDIKDFDFIASSTINSKDEIEWIIKTRIITISFGNKIK